MFRIRHTALPGAAAAALARFARHSAVLAVVAGVFAGFLTHSVAAQDLSIQLSLAEETRLRGEPVTVNFVVANPTTVDANRYRVDFYASRDDTLEDQDRLLGAFGSVDLLRGKSFQENTIELDTCLLDLGEWRILGRIEDVRPEDTDPGNDIGLARGTLSLLRDDDDPGTCIERQGAAGHINPGLNDAWFNPETPGQGFLVNVFGDSGNVFLAWFTFDVESPAPGARAFLGDPRHRWLTAFGTFEGSRATLEVTSTRGGRFDRPDPAPFGDAVGRITLSFTNCATGTIAYDFPETSLVGEIPIRRVADDNRAFCETLEAASTVP